MPWRLGQHGHQDDQPEVEVSRLLGDLGKALSHSSDQKKCSSISSSPAVTELPVI
jgi:hypothetical protein